MKIWDVLKTENIGKRYRTKIYGMDETLKVDYDINSYTYLTLKSDNDYVKFPLSQMYLGCILQMDFEEIK